MIANPFVFTDPAVGPTVACHRDEQAIRNVADALLRGDYYVIIGSKLSGTSTFARNVLQRAQEREANAVCLYVDLKKLANATDQRSLFRNIARSACCMPEEKLPSYSRISGSTTFRDWLVAIVKDRPRRLILALDNLDGMHFDSERVRELARFVRSLFNERANSADYRKITVMLSGSQSPYSLSTGRGSPLNIAIRHSVDDLTNDESMQLLLEGARRAEVEFDDAGLAEVVSLTSGDKYFIQRIGSMCVLDAHRLGLRTISKAMITRLVKRLTRLDYRKDACFAGQIESIIGLPGLAKLILGMLDGKRVITSDIPLDIDKIQLTGIATVRDGALTLRNEIYRRFLSNHLDLLKHIAWVDDHNTERDALRLGLHDVAQKIASILDPDTTLSESMTIVRTVSRADMVAIFLYDRTIGRLRLESVDPPGNHDQATQLVGQCAIGLNVVRNGRIESADQANSFCWQCNNGTPQCPCIWVPIRISNDEPGAIAFCFSGSQDFADEYTEQQAATLSGHLAVAVSRTRIIEVVQELSEVDVVSLPKYEVLNLIAGVARRVLNVPEALIWGVADSEDALQVVAYSGKARPIYVEKQIKTFRLSLESEYVKRLLQEQRPPLPKNVQRFKHYPFKALAQELGWHSSLAVPLEFRGKPIGLIELCTYDEWKMSAWEEVLLKLLAHQAAATIARASGQQMVKDANRNLNLALQVFTHQLRTEAAYVAGTIDILLANKLGRLERRQRNRLQKTARRLYEHHVFINSMNMYGRIRGDKLVMTKEPVHLGELIQAVGNNRRPDATSKNIRLSIYAKGLPIVEVDKGMIEIVIFNLVDNALKFTPKGGTVGIRAWLDDRCDIHVAVDDTGPGIPNSEWIRIFGEHYQLEPPPNVKSGAGVGLYIVENLVLMHKGTVSVRPKRGRGTRIEVILPAEVRYEEEPQCGNC